MSALTIQFGAGFTVAICLALGCVLLRDAATDIGLRFVAGAAVLSAAVFALCTVGLAYPLVFAVGALAAVFWGLRRGLVMPKAVLPRLAVLAFGVYFVLYFFNAMAPEISYDGSRYHLGLVGRYLREHGFHRITGNMYASLSQGIEMLYLFAFAFGQHSAAAMVHFAFLLALAWMILSYARRAGFPAAGICASLLVFASPMVGVDGTSAYNDVAVAAIAFALFYLLQVWDADRNARLLPAIGMVAGFAFAAKYTAWLAAPYALGFVAWKSRRLRDVAVVAFCASLLAAPWMAKNWVWVQNPLAPFYNDVFPNPHVTSAFEREYRQNMALYNLKSRWEIPMQVTVHGSLGGLLGPVFLLSPVAMLALRRREGRQLLLAALVFGANYFANIGTRFLIPPLAFIALAMAFALSGVPRVALAVALLHAAISWPSVLRHYCRVDAWHLVKVPFREALRIKPEDGFLESNLPYYGAVRMIERHTPPGATVFAFTPIPEAYTSRNVLVAYQSAGNIAVKGILWSQFVPVHSPTWRLRFTFPQQSVRALRIVQTNLSSDVWSIHEVKPLPDGPALAARGRVTANPYSWGIEQAFDGDPLTFWACGDTMHPGQFVQIDFARLEELDSVLIEAAPNQPGLRLQLDGQDPAGKWKALAASPEISDAPAVDRRRAASAELRKRGIDYLIMFDGEFGADEFRQKHGRMGNANGQRVQRSEAVPTAMRLFLGVDGGQSATKAVIGDESGRILGAGTAGPCNHMSAGEGRAKLERAVAGCVAAACQEAGIDAASVRFEAACFGMSGGPDDKETILAEILRTDELIVTTDAVIALSGAISGGQGIITIAGTGSIAFGRNAEGRTARAGGWGYIYGDEGSAFHIGRQAIRAALRMEEGWGPSTRLHALLLEATDSRNANEVVHRFYTRDWPRQRVARLAEKVDTAAEQGDEVAVAILHGAAQDQATFVGAVRSQLWKPGEPVQVAYIGGGFRSRLLLERFQLLVELEDGNRCGPPLYGPAEGALLEAYRAAGLAPQFS